MLLSIVVPTFCEELSLQAHYDACMRAVQDLRERSVQTITYEYLIIDNCSDDNTVDVALSIREIDENVRILVNDKNYGPVLSPFAGMMHARGDIILLIAADLQEPPDLLPELFSGIASGHEASIAYKAQSREPTLMWLSRGAYYKLLRLLDLPVLPYRYSGFGLYNRELVERLRSDRSEEPSMRILVPKYAKSIYPVPYTHSRRFAGGSSYSLYGYSREAVKNIARNGSSFAIMAGKMAIATAMISLFLIPCAVAIKLTFWKSMTPGLTTILIGYLLSNSVLLGFIAILLDQQASIIKKLPHSDERVKHSEVYGNN
jgi:glycosyltransferase involved in cell wall biosynthesis